MMITVEMFRLRCRHPHPIQNNPYFCKYFIRYDLMHNADHNGVTGTAISSQLAYLICCEARLGGTQQARLDKLNELKKVYYTSVHVSSTIGELKMQHIFPNGPSSWAELHGPRIKTVGTRHLAPWLISLTQEYCNSGSIEHKTMRSLARNLNSMYDIIYESDVFMSAGELVRLEDSVVRIGECFQLLRDFSRRGGDDFATCCGAICLVSAVQWSSSRSFCATGVSWRFCLAHERRPDDALVVPPIPVYSYRR